MNTLHQTPALELLKQYFGYDQFRGQQEEIIQTVANKKDCLVLMPTGGGKSICYQIPALMHEGITLVVSPLISLMKDQVDALRGNGIEAAFMNSSLSYEQENEIAARCFHGKIKLLYMAPEKVLSSLENFVKRLPFSLIAIDEAHCVSQWGHDFRPEYKELSKLRVALPHVPIMALTATADKITRTDILLLLGLIEPLQFVSSFDRPNLSLTVKSGMQKREKLRDITQFLKQHPNECGIIYCTSRSSTEVVASELTQLGVKAKAYHAGLHNNERSKVQEAFIKDDVQVVCATVAFGMGIDKSNVRFVMHYNLPKSIESYYQEIGRGGRDGLPCETILYYTIGDLMMLRSFADQSGQPGINVDKLSRMQAFAEAKHCRRRILLNYFGQNLAENCGNCDVCKHPPVNIDGTVLAQKVLSALTRLKQLGEYIGSYLLIDVLRGMKHSGIFERKLNTIKTYGAGADLTARQWNGYILQMIQLGVVEIAHDRGNVLFITPFGEQVLKGVMKLYLNEPLEIDFKSGKDRIKKDKKLPVAITEKSEQYGTDLFEKLRLLRKRIADEEGLPPYVIFHDTTLYDMITKNPQTLEAMLGVSGVSTNKKENYGERFLEVIAGHKGKSVASNETDYLSETKLKEYKDELDKKRLKFSTAVVGHLLAGDSSDRYLGIGKQVSFYGVLRGKMGYVEIRKCILPLYEPMEIKVKEEKKKLAVELEEKRTQQMKHAELYFESKLFNALSPALWTEWGITIAGLPIQKVTKNTSEAMQQMRKQFPRANEPWTTIEETIFAKAIKATNDLPLLTKTMGRSARSVIAMAVKYLV